MRLPIGLLGMGVFVSLTAAQPAAAQVSGTFVFTGTTDCVVVVSPATFNSSNQPTAGPVFSGATHDVGTITFNSNGTGAVNTVLAVSTSTPLPPGSSFTPADSSTSASTVTWNFTYTVSGNIIVILLTSGTYNESIVSGPRAGQTATLDKRGLAGYISADGNHFLAISEGTFIQTKTFSNGDVRPAMCAATDEGFKFP